jgi:hypothetical protein
MIGPYTCDFLRPPLIISEVNENIACIKIIQQAKNKNPRQPGISIELLYFAITLQERSRKQ